MPVCRARLSYTLVKGLSRTALWPMAVAALVRLAAWALLPGARFASDEQGYVDAGIALAATGQQDLFWPPLTGWIVAAIKTIAPAAPLAAIRLVWIAMDLANVALVAVLAGRIGPAARCAATLRSMATSPADESSASRVRRGTGSPPGPFLFQAIVSQPELSRTRIRSQPEFGRLFSEFCRRASVDNQHMPSGRRPVLRCLGQGES